MRWLRPVLRVPDTGILSVQRIPVQEEPLFHMVAKGTGAVG
jgi:hypothetical protein